MGEIQYYTEEGLKRLKDELQMLKTKGRTDISLQIAEARDKGDLSENAEYDAAKDAQGHLELKIAKLEAVVGNARVLDSSQLDTSKVGILTTVKIKNVKNGMTVSYTLVSEQEADLKAGKISLGSPFGKGLVGKKVGDIVKGHVLVVPKQEVDYIFDLEAEVLSGLHLFAQQVAKAMDKTIKCTRIGVAVIGLEVPHVHVHLVPLRTMDDINFTRPKLKLTNEELAEIAERIREAV